jgi:hypothetical protein
VFDGDLSETKKEALAKYQQRISKTQQDWASQIMQKASNSFKNQNPI